MTEKHFKEKLSRVLGLGATTPDAATVATGVRGLMFGDYMVPGNIACTARTHAWHKDLTSYNRIPQKPTCCMNPSFQ